MAGRKAARLHRCDHRTPLPKKLSDNQAKKAKFLVHDFRIVTLLDKVADDFSAKSGHNRLCGIKVQGFGQFLGSYLRDQLTDKDHTPAFLVHLRNRLNHRSYGAKFRSSWNASAAAFTPHASAARKPLPER